ncbi:MAG: hypothetical protein A2987_00595 [Omnitrophica bacterium RIFCSPLOWO2_01_FULL_45_10]|nr:MAG: hypothetical protein A2987_00595 [Omnitrophica bacterium RIFCSPLOWO2_01_FULL_45_10]
MAGIKFGTDGWRAVISEDFTFENVKRVAQAIADYVKSERPILKERQFKLAVGYDTRFLSRTYAGLVASVLGANGIKVILTDRPTPTPSISYAIKDRNLFGGVMITASHNPAQYNGIKYKAYYGGSAMPEITERIEYFLSRQKNINYGPLDEFKAKGFVKTEDMLPRHLEFIKNYVNLNLLKKAGFKLFVDSMYGTGNGYIAQILKGGKGKVETMHGGINPGFDGINPEPKLPNLNELVKKVKLHGYDIGIATDGDADRVGIASRTGKLLTGHKIMALLLLHLLEDRHMTGGVIQTVCGTVLIERIAQRFGLKTYETPVGFKYISDIMRNEDILLGGEETGGVQFKDSIPERDGILSGLLILEMMAMRKKPLEAIIKDIDRKFGTFEYRRLDIKYPDEKKQLLMKALKRDPLDKILGKRVAEIKDIDGYKFICEDSTWLMLRLSGTEPILRVYAEAPTEKTALKILRFGKRLAYSI